MSLILINLSDTRGIQGIQELLMNPACVGTTVFHTPEWNQVVAEVFNTRFFYLALEENGKLQGVMPCHLCLSEKGYSVCYSPPTHFGTPYGGPVALGENLADICTRLAQAATKISDVKQVVMYTSPYLLEWSQPSIYWKRSKFQTACVDLRNHLNEIWMNSLDGKRRNMIRKAEKSGVKVVFGGNDLLALYYPLSQDIARRAGIKVLPFEYFQKVFEYFGHADQARVYLAYEQDDLLACGIFLRYCNKVYFWQGARKDQSPNLGQGELIQWQVIQWGREAECDLYDLVVVEKERLPHIAEFKLGFTKHLFPYSCVTYTDPWLRGLNKLKRLIH